MREPIMTIQEVAKYTRVPVNTLRYLRVQGRGPKSGKIASRIMYRQRDVDAWIDAAFETGKSA